jgi:L-arabinokinase
MLRVIEGNTPVLADTEEFIKLVNSPPAELGNFFDAGSDIFISRAPGRLDVMGGIADYSGSLVLQMPIEEATFAAVQMSNYDRIRIVSYHAESNNDLLFEMDLADLECDSDEHYYDSAKKFFARDPSSHWASYAAGVFFVLKHELGLQFDKGWRILIASQVPVGKGVSSSAALEVATMQAVCHALGVAVAARDLAILCQKVENYIVGAACGVMDQIAVSCGVENSLISLLCQPAKIKGTIHIPDEVEFWGIDSGVCHSIAAADYSSVRIGAFIGYRIIAQRAGLPTKQIGNGYVAIDDDRWGGYLANISPNQYERDFESVMPAAIRGDEFLKTCGGITDIVTKVEPSRVYAVKAPTEHAIYENSRVRAFASLLNEKITDENLERLGRLMFESHESYSACGLTEPRTNRIVELVKQNRMQGLNGARITGGGTGGTVAVLARQNSRKAIENVVHILERETGHRAYVFHGSSPGAERSGRIRLGVIGE